MKKNFFYAIAFVCAMGAMTACGNSEKETNCQCPENCECVENCHEGTNCTCPEGCTDCTGCACTETAEQAVDAALQDGEPVEVDVTGAEVVNEPNGTQEVQTEVTMTPEQAQ